MTAPQPDELSLQRRYQQFREREIEFYKQVVSRRSVMRIAQDASDRILARPELQLGELTLAQEVDALIAARIGVPSFKRWRLAAERKNGRKRAPSPRAEQLQLPMPSSDAAAGTVLVLQPRNAGAWERFCERGRNVIVIEPDDRERSALETHASRSGWTHLLRTSATNEPLHERVVFTSVLYSPAACSDLSEPETVQLIDRLKEATVSGGTHIVDGLIDDREVLPEALLQRSYSSWTTTASGGRRNDRVVTTRFQKA